MRDKYFIYAVPRVTACHDDQKDKDEHMKKGREADLYFQSIGEGYCRIKGDS